MKRQLFAAATLMASLTLGQTAHAADCPVDVEDPFALEAAAIEEIYACIKDDLAAGYAKEGNAVAAAYRGWTVSSTRPAVAGAHGNRLLYTFANDIAAEQYLKYADEGVTMPVGSVLAKESITISAKKKAAVPGPLFIMTKGEAGSVPETNDWVYGGLQPDGKPMKFKQSFCHDCHVAWEAQDMLAYPLEEVRLAN
ncbi:MULTISPECIES: cytochrome P460 family protein [unclassified Roseovarius]|uniref:cytochrome P460 family protein n=1 Tax=unclassified Roseovarius TaxID=2614913 RepID=UPI00006864AA|nr:MULTISPECIES: cytochrome P460 family protein [unclassified Roseovarius]EAQ24033.1 tyrosine recombinase [Roseovarius sp. 217]KJS44716.1 MAG: recombinase [Roseovarius sp. BRH_c41]